MTRRVDRLAVLGVSMLFSGAAALLFEALWFRLAGLSLGNSVWASSLVLAAFMGGLAGGNTLAMLLGSRVRRPLRAYAALEVAIGVSGACLVLLFPRLGELSLLILRPVQESPWLLNGLRAAIAFGLMLIPATAMGATLPLVLRGAHSVAEGAAGVGAERGYGRNLGLLYGLNTLGAVGGALLADLAFIPALGVRATGFTAAAFNLGAAGVALGLARSLPGRRGEKAPVRALLGPESRLLLAAAFLAGGILLALEVVWFRFLLLFMHGTSLAFAVMLAVVLLGIALGGLIGSSWLGLREGAERFAPHLGCLAGVSCLAAWGYGDRLLPFFGYLYFYDAPRVFGFTAAIVFPVCVLSGVLFTLLGTLLRRFVADEATATGALTLANTFGAMLGALAGGFLLLPRLGMERSLYLLAALYGLVALLAWLPLARALPARPRGRWGLAAAAVALVTAVATLPLGDPNRYLGVPAQRYASMGEPVVIREGLTDTVTVLRNARWGEPYYHLLLTNGFSMAASTYGGRRYMGLFAYWPAVFRPEPRSALLISYGLGITADALTRVPSLETIDVVDISPDVLAMAPVIFPPPSRTPLEDPRVRVHVEDGRFFLLATDRRFDVITAEPPPPKTAGVVNLYSREYFALVRSRLADSGVATHWLPVDQLYLEENKAVIRAFCDVFEDCSLWTGLLNHWMLVGSRGLPGGLSPEALAQPWRDPGLRAGLFEVGFESPELLAATFLADAGMLRALTAGVEPLTDDHPYRVGPRPVERPSPFYGEFMDPLAARARFAESAAMAGLMDAELRGRVLAGYDQHLLWHRTLEVTAGLRAAERFHWLARTLETSALRTPVLVMMDSDPRFQALVERAVARGVDDRELDYQLGVRAMADRDYAAADRLLDRSQPEGPGADPVTYYRALAAHLDGRPADAEALVERAREALREAGRSPESVPSGGFWEWWEWARAAPGD